MSEPVRYVDPAVVGEFVEACDRAIAEVRKLEVDWRGARDDSGVDLARRMEKYLTDWREAAREGRLPAPTGDFNIGISRFASEYDWGHDGRPFVEAAYEAERIWRRVQ